MKKFNSLNKDLDMLRDKSLICILSSIYTITIPKLIRESLKLRYGDEVTISLKSKDLVIQKVSGDTLENKMILNDRGSVRIPAELIKLLFLKKGDTFKLYLISNNQCVLLRKNGQ